MGHYTELNPNMHVPDIFAYFLDKEIKNHPTILTYRLYYNVLHNTETQYIALFAFSDGRIFDMCLDETLRKATGLKDDAIDPNSDATHAQLEIAAKLIINKLLAYENKVSGTRQIYPSNALSLDLKAVITYMHSYFKAIEESARFADPNFFRGDFYLVDINEANRINELKLLGIEAE